MDQVSFIAPRVSLSTWEQVRCACSQKRTGGECTGHAVRRGQQGDARTTGTGRERSPCSASCTALQFFASKVCCGAQTEVGRWEWRDVRGRAV